MLFIVADQRMQGAAEMGEQSSWGGAGLVVGKAAVPCISVWMAGQAAAGVSVRPPRGVSRLVTGSPFPTTAGPRLLFVFVPIAPLRPVVTGWLPSSLCVRIRAGG